MKHPLNLFLCEVCHCFLLQLCQEGQKRLSGELGEGIGDYDYNNANDTANFCPGVQVWPLFIQTDTIERLLWRSCPP